MLRRIVALLLLAALTLPAATAAQPLQWNERQTTYIAVLYPAGSEAEAERYIAFADQIYTEITTAVGYKPAPPLTLRIYPTMEIYRQVNPLAQSLEGIVAHAHTGRREISIAVPQTVGQTDEEIAAASLGVKSLLGFYGSTPSYKPVLDVEGWGDLQPQLNVLSKQGDWRGMAASVSDEMLATIGVVGRPAEIGAEIARRFGHVADRVCLYFPGYPISDECTAETVAAVKEAAAR